MKPEVLTRTIPALRHVLAAAKISHTPFKVPNVDPCISILAGTVGALLRLGVF